MRALAGRFAAFTDQLYAPPWSAEWYVKEAKMHGIDGVVFAPWVGVMVPSQVTAIGDGEAMDPVHPHRLRGTDTR